MGSFLARFFGHKAAHKILRNQTRRGGLFDIKYGFALLKDNHVPVATKLLALSLGVGVTVILFAMEVPFELLLGIFLPVIGEAADLLVDGAELILFPMIVACMILPRLVRQPAYVVQAPPVQSEIIDMPPPMLG